MIEKLNSEQIYSFMHDNMIGAHTMVEMNVNWRLIPKQHSINEFACGWFEIQKISTSYNIHDRICKQHQQSDTGIIAQGELGLWWMGVENIV